VKIKNKPRRLTASDATEPKSGIGLKLNRNRWLDLLKRGLNDKV
jgi:hypothetical protein